MSTVPRCGPAEANQERRDGVEGWRGFAALLNANLRREEGA